jgi:ABC-type multidrug transport system fused ATPase/permease subunit
MSGVTGRDTIMAHSLGLQLAEVMAEQVHNGQMPGYVFRSLQIGLRLVLGLVNACIAIVLAVLLTELRGSDHPVGWARMALVNTVSLGTDLILLMTWWVRLEASMGSFKRIMEYTGTQYGADQNQRETVTEKGINKGDIQLRGLTVFHGSVMHGPFFAIAVSRTRLKSDARSTKVINNVSLSISSGQKVAIVGRSGRSVRTLRTKLWSCLFLGAKGEGRVD